MKDPAAERSVHSFFYRLVKDHGGEDVHRCIVCRCLPGLKGVRHTLILPKYNYSFLVCSSAYCQAKRPR